MFITKKAIRANTKQEINVKSKEFKQVILRPKKCRIKFSSPGTESDTSVCKLEMLSEASRSSIFVRSGVSKKVVLVFNCRTSAIVIITKVQHSGNSYVLLYMMHTLTTQEFKRV